MENLVCFVPHYIYYSTGENSLQQKDGRTGIQKLTEFLNAGFCVEKGLLQPCEIKFCTDTEILQIAHGEGDAYTGNRKTAEVDGMATVAKKRASLEGASLGRGKRFRSVLRRDGALYLMAAIPVLYFIIFKYVPMLGLNIAFRDFKVGSDLLAFGEDFVGLQWFKEFFGSPFASRVITNTVVLSLLNLLITFPLPILLALAFNEIRRPHLRGFCQTVSYLPYFMSVAVVVSIMTNMFSVNSGIVNELLGRIGIGPIDFMQSNDWFRQMYIGSTLWTTMGFNSIIFASAIASVDTSLYEAAFVDGSTRFKNILYVTLPCIAPTIIMMLLLRMGQIMTVGYEKILLMYNSQNMQVADVISTYVYRNGIQQGKFGYAAAVDLFNSVINIIMLVSTNYISRKRTGTSIF